jgi:hypothetical protein
MGFHIIGLSAYTTKTPENSKLSGAKLVAGLGFEPGIPQPRDYEPSFQCKRRNCPYSLHNLRTTELGAAYKKPLKTLSFQGPNWLRG